MIVDKPLMVAGIELRNHYHLPHQHIPHQHLPHRHYHLRHHPHYLPCCCNHHQYQPKLFVNNQLVPCIEIGKSFCYLGRYFDFNMSDERHKSELCDLFSSIISKIDELPLHPRNKILLYSRYLLSKISWELTVTDISKT